MNRVLYYEGESDYDLYLYNGRYYSNNYTLSFAFDLTISSTLYYNHIIILYYFFLYYTRMLICVLPWYGQIPMCILPPIVYL